MNKTHFRLVVVILFFLSAMADIVSTFWRKGMLIFEANPLHANPYLMVILKVAAVLLIAYLYYKPQGHVSFQHFYALAVLLLTLVQFYAAVNNAMIVHGMADVPDVELTDYILSREQMTTQYYGTIITLIYWPILMSILGFELWRWSYGAEKRDLQTGSGRVGAGKQPSDDAGDRS